MSDSAEDEVLDWDSYEITVPPWATSLEVGRDDGLADGEWVATVTGDSYGVGTESTWQATGINPRDAVNKVTDMAEGWTTFVLTGDESNG